MLWHERVDDIAGESAPARELAVTRRLADLSILNKLVKKASGKNNVAICKN